MNAGGFARCVTARTSCQGGCEGDDQMSAHRRNRVCDMSFGTAGRRLGVEDFGERQMSRIYRRQRRRLRGEPSPARRSGRHRRRCTRWVMVESRSLGRERVGALPRREEPLHCRREHLGHLGRREPDIDHPGPGTLHRRYHQYAPRDTIRLNSVCIRKPRRASRRSNRSPIPFRHGWACPGHPRPEAADPVVPDGWMPGTSPRHDGF